MDTNRKKIVDDFKEYQDISENDMNAYELLYTHLEEKNTDGFSLGFSKNIIQKIEAKQQRSFNIKIYCLASILILIGIPFFIGFMDQEFFTLLLSTFLKYKFVVLMVLAGVVLIHFSDQLISKNKID